MSTSVRWPTFDLPHSQTLRACVYRYALGSKLWLIAYGGGVAAAAAFHIYSLPSMPSATPGDSNNDPGTSAFLWHIVLYAGIAIALPSLLVLRHLRSAFRSAFAVVTTSRWRKSWSDFEAASRAFDAKVPAKVPPDGSQLFVQLLNEAPRLPVRRRIELDEYEEAIIPTGIPNDGSQRFNANEPLLGLLLCLLSYWKVPQATGYSNNTIAHVQMLDSTTQYWAFVSTVTTGPTISLRYQSGVLWWTEPCTLTDGTAYPGDISRLRNRYATGSLALGVLGVLLYPFYFVFNPVWRFLVDIGRMSIPLLVLFVLTALFFGCLCTPGIINMASQAITGFASVFRPLFFVVLSVPLAIAVLFRLVIDRTTTVGKLLTTWDLADGDATDLIALGIERRSAGGFGVVLNEHQKLALRDARFHTRRLCMKAFKQIEAKARPR